MPQTPFNWTCPYCERDVTIAAQRYGSAISSTFEAHGGSEGTFGVFVRYIVCPNSECAKTTVEADLHRTQSVSGNMRPVGDAIDSWRLKPWGASRTFPEYVPQAIRADYIEACAVKMISPKAAATLARRAVQGIVRDFWGVSGKTLFAELESLKEKVGTSVNQETWDNIDAIRTVGNIGAHMEQDVNVIIDVEPDEAELLIELVETMIDDTYVDRAKRQERSRQVQAMKAAKLAAKSPPIPPQAKPT